MAHKSDWRWPTVPTDDGAFDSMLASADEYLARRGCLPRLRPWQAKILISDTFGFSAPLFGLNPAAPPPSPFGAMDLLRRVDQWYEQNYGKRLRPPFLARSFVVKLRSTPWRVRMPVMFGTICIMVDVDMNTPYGGGAINLLQQIDDFTPDYAGRLRPDELNALLDTSKVAVKAIEFLNDAPESGLGEQARLDYEHSVDALMSGVAWSKARWETAQCAEKVLKCLLEHRGYSYPKGSDGHNISGLGALLEQKLGIRIDQAYLQAIDCKPAVRYGEEAVEPCEAFQAHRALLQAFADLSNVVGNAAVIEPDASDRRGTQPFPKVPVA